MADEQPRARQKGRKTWTPAQREDARRRIQEVNARRRAEKEMRDAETADERRDREAREAVAAGQEAIYGGEVGSQEPPPEPEVDGGEGQKVAYVPGPRVVQPVGSGDEGLGDAILGTAGLDPRDPDEPDDALAGVPDSGPDLPVGAGVRETVESLLGARTGAGASGLPAGPEAGGGADLAGAGVRVGRRKARYDISGIKHTEPEWVSRASDDVPLRAVHMVKPECQVPVTVRQGNIYGEEMTTGPCQQLVYRNPDQAFRWFETCIHGPEVDERGVEIPAELRKYFEGNVIAKALPRVGPDGIVRDPEVQSRWVVRLRLYKVKVSDAVMSQEAVQYWQERGGKFAHEFGITGICQFNDCWVRKGVRRYRNGMFCSPLHAQLIWAAEHRIVLPTKAAVDMEGSWAQSPNAEKRREILSALPV